MYADLEINSTGDLLFTSRDVKTFRQKIRVNICATKAQRIKFHVEQEGERNKSYGFKASFMLKDPEIGKFANVVKGEAVKAQLARLALKICKGELKERPEMGSSLLTFSHQNMNEKSLKMLKTVLEKELKEFIDVPEVTVAPFVSTASGYRQGVVITVKDNSKVILEYKEL